MKLSMLWLREWVHFALTPQQLGHQLTMAGLEVDAVNPVAGQFTQVVVAQVLATKPHPNADKLTVCEVAANKDQVLQIVCGAANVRPGLKVALACVGAVLPGEFVIKESSLRGELSCGMLCSAEELGLAEQSDGLLELDADAPVGMDLREYLTLDDMTLDLELTPNRADCFSALGVAREIAVLNNLPLREPPVAITQPSIDDKKTVQVQAPEACARYCGRIVRGINPLAQTPLWMRERLRRSGMRLVHPVVDTINYVMMECGQPMHAFDLATIDGAITVRFSADKESISLLDGQTIALEDKVLVVADAKKPLALAGVMGSEDSAVTADTCDVFLESAYFNPTTVAGVARKYGLHSDASQRFERGVDPNLQIKALERATSLLLSIAGGKAGPLVEISDSSHLPPKRTITLDPAKVEKLTGLHIAQETMCHLLKGLGMGIQTLPEGRLEISVPSYRFDMQLDVDVVEEIIRLYGYDKLQTKPPMVLAQAGHASAHEARMTCIAHWFSNKGYHETISYSFVDPHLQASVYPDAECMQLINPISSELSQMRVGMWPGLIASMVYNLHRQQSMMKLFEIGVVFESSNAKVREKTCIAGLLTGEYGATHWSEPTRFLDFYDAKGDVQSLLSCLDIAQVEFVPATHAALHPGQCASIVIHGQPAGWIGVLHPRLGDALDLQQEVLLFEVDLDKLVNLDPARYKKISKYPQIKRDLSFLIGEAILVSQVEAAVRAVIKSEWLKSFEVFDVYKGPGVPEGQKSLAVTMTLQDDNRTLVDAEINSLIDAIISTLTNNFSIILRD